VGKNTKPPRTVRDARLASAGAAAHKKCSALGQGGPKAGRAAYAI